MALNLDMESMDPTQKLVTALAMVMVASDKKSENEWSAKAMELSAGVPNSARAKIREAAIAKAEEIMLACQLDTMPAPTNTKEALTMALFLSITATDDDKAARAMALVDDFASGMSEAEIEECKTAAQIQVFGAEHVAAEQAAGHAINRAMSR